MSVTHINYKYTFSHVKSVIRNECLDTLFLLQFAGISHNILYIFIYLFTSYNPIHTIIYCVHGKYEYRTILV